MLQIFQEMWTLTSITILKIHFLKIRCELWIAVCGKKLILSYFVTGEKCIYLTCMCNIWQCEVKEKWLIVISTDLLNLSVLCIQLIKGKAMRCEKGHIWASGSNSGLNLGWLTRFLALSKWLPRILVFLCDTLTLPSCKVMVIMRKQYMIWIQTLKETLC